jgi:hypothetical protein
MGRLIRHARPTVTLAVRTLPVPVVEPAFRTPLVAAIGSTTLLAPGFRTASGAAIALPAIAMRTNPEHRLASLAAANPQPENHFSMNRHPPTQADFDNGNGPCQGRTSLSGGLLTKVAEPEPRCSNGGVLLPPFKPQYNFSLECFDADD